jgi:hypothetical protein
LSSPLRAEPPKSSPAASDAPLASQATAVVAAAYGQGFDDLPGEGREHFAGALATSFAHAELLSALGCAVRGLLMEAEEVRDLAAKVASQLERLVAVWHECP